ncbi:carboxylesterase/lipase family protein [Agromyces sp. Soil535]|uniref:carboxylesterase/lipase family protein n=1 Tax=Agromyces sp. Soil535 TaxID=1736390 RepID=UPI0006FAB40E|nr:carboxylesterase family protein [Agromyces sp. Soil535]KRE31305.1 carboxylesterase [Agromyces sp. Soil535]
MTQTSTGTLVEADTTAGRVRGAWRGEPGTAGASAAFLGIPFAEAPVGELRFAAPVPHRPWEGARDALDFGATAQRGDPGVTLIPEPSVPGESTLNVNVFTPAPAPTAVGEGLPVLVYVHGGGYFAGSPASPWYDGAAFNRDGVVTVSVSYRLGFDGFGWIADAPLNRGVLDWLLALEWVRDNVAAFGGDPARVTIAGQSAGGGAVLALLGMPKAQPLIAAVYSISGAAADVSLADAEAFGRRLAEAGGVEPTRAGLSRLSEERVLELQQKLTASVEGGNPLDGLRSFIDGGLSLGPVIDGDLVPMATVEAIRAGIGADKPLVLGATDDEFSMILDGAKDKLRWVPARYLLGKVGLKGGARSAYLAANREVTRRGTAAIVGRYLTDRMFRTLALRIARARGAAPTWLYRFSWRSPNFGSAVHCVDVPFFFDCLGAERVGAIAGEHPPQALADDVHGGAVAFVQHGDPGWSRFTDAAGTARVYDTPSRTAADGYAGVRPLVAP